MTEHRLVSEVIREQQNLLDAALVKFRHCLAQLDDDQIWWRPGPGLHSIANLALHVCGNLTQWVLRPIDGGEDRRDRQTEFSQDRTFDRAAVLNLLDATAEQVNKAIAALDLDGLLQERTVQAFDVTILGAITHSVTHFVGHTHQVILLTRMQLGDAYQFAWSPEAERDQVPI